MNRLRIACLLGTGFEFFEFQIFALLTPVWIAIFFNPQTNLTNRYLSGYLLFGVAFIARLIGAIGLGFIADHLGRRTALFLAMWLMSISTVLIGLLPTYSSIGVAAFVFLLIFRIGQGLSLGGEFSIGSVLLYENKIKSNCMNLIWQDLGGTGGLFLATLLITLSNNLFTTGQMILFGWRVPFLIAFIASLWVIKIRGSIQNSSDHQSLVSINQQRSTKQYYHNVFRYWRSISLLALCCAPNGVFWYLQIMYIPNQIIPISSLMMLFLIALTWICIPLGALIADNWGLYRTWSFSIVALIVNFSGLILHANPRLQLVGLCIQSVLLSINQGPRLFILNLQFPLAIRGCACSLTYSIANIIGGLTPFVSLWLLNRTHNNRYLLLLLLALCSLALIAMRRIMFVTYSDEPASAITAA